MSKLNAVVVGGLFYKTNLEDLFLKSFIGHDDDYDLYVSTKLDPMTLPYPLRLSATMAVLR